MKNQFIGLVQVTKICCHFRVMYVAKFAEKIYVLHSFQKKTQKTKKQDIEITRIRYKAIVNEEDL